jgi:hypothetical protein
LNILFKTHVPTVNDIKILLQYDSYYTCFRTLVKDNPNFAGFSMESVLEFVNKKLNNSLDKYDDHKMIDIFVDTYDMSDKALSSEIFMIRDTYFNLKLAEKLKGYKLDISKHYMQDACKILPYSKAVIKVLVSDKNMELDSECLETACQYCDFNGIKYILDETKLKITKNHFNKLIISENYIPSQYNSYGYRSNYYNYGKSGYTLEKMELLIAHGYSPDYDDIKYAIKHKKEIPNIDRFGVKLDKELLELCWDNNFYPSYKFDCISDEMIKLQKICADKSPISVIRSHLKKYQLVPDRKCMENASLHKNNVATMKELLKYGGKLTYKCLKSQSYLLTSSSTLDYMLEEYEKQQEEVNAELNSKMEKYETRIKELEEKLANGEIDNQDIKSDTKQNAKQDTKPNTVKQSAQSTDISPSTELIDTDDDFDDDDLEEIKNCNIIKIDDTVVIKLPKQKRRKCNVPKLYASYFKKGSKTKMSYIEIKKELLDNVRDNKWYNPDNKQLIKLPDDLRKHLGIQTSGYVRFDDVDKLVNLFYK